MSVHAVGLPAQTYDGYAVVPVLGSGKEASVPTVDRSSSLFELKAPQSAGSSPRFGKAPVPRPGSRAPSDEGGERSLIAV